MTITIHFNVKLYTLSKFRIQWSFYAFSYIINCEDSDMNNNENGLPIVPITLNIDYNATNLVDQTITKASGTVTNTVIALWSITFGWLDYYADKKRIERAANLFMYQELCNKKFSEIPPEHLTEPRISILGPAIQSSEFYFEEEHYREMFANLIASSMDITKNNLVHPSFVDIIKQMSSTDALIFAAHTRERDTNIGTYPIAKVLISSGKFDVLSRKLKNILLISDDFKEIDSTEVSISLTNLFRLGLIDISFTATFSDKSIYSYVDENPLVKEYRKISNNPQLEDIEKGTFELTSFGYSFANTCL